MISFKVKKTGNQTERLLQNLKKSQKISVDVGHFENQMHYSGYSMPDLMLLHHIGYPPNNTPSRPIREITNFKLAYDEMAFKPFDIAIANNFSPTSVEKALTSIGDNVKDLEKTVFGDTSDLDRNSSYTIRLKGRDEPMVDTGSLREGIKVRINK